MRNSDENRTHSRWEQSNGSFIHEAMEKKMIDGRHFEMGNIFPFQDDSFSMSISQLKEKILPIEDLEAYWFWRAIYEEKVSLRDLIIGALQHVMECKVLHQFEEDGILQREDTMFMQNIIHHPYWDKWVRMIRNGLHKHL